MNSLNSILIEGRLVRDPEASTTPAGTALCTFSVACERFYREGEKAEPKKEVSYFDVSTWARLAEICSTYLKKGRGVRVVGRLRQDRWTDNDNRAHSRVYIVAEHVEFRPQLRKAEGEPADQAGSDSPTDGERDEAEATGTPL